MGDAMGGAPIGGPATLSPTVGVLVMAYGTPESPDDLERYYTDIRRGRPPTPELLAELRARYEAIGGLSPLAGLTRSQAARVAEALEQRRPGRFSVAVGLKHSAPFIEDGVLDLLARGVTSIVGIVLAPHWSTMSVGQYHARAEEAAGAVPYAGIRGWHTEPELVALLAERAVAARDGLPDPPAAHLVVTAHSLPLRAVEADATAGGGPSYEEQLAETTAAVAGQAGFEEWHIAFQSAGRTPDPWLGPDLLEVIPALAGKGVEGIVVCPAGFTADHLEVLHDIDIEAKAGARDAGVALARTSSLNDDPRFCALLARLVAARAGSLTVR